MRSYAKLGAAVASFAVLFGATADVPAQEIQSPYQKKEQQYTQAELDDALFKVVRTLAFRLEFNFRNNPSNYNAIYDETLARGINQTINILKLGADANQFRPYEFNAMSGRNMSVFDGAIMIAGFSGRPDLVDAFLAHGASPHGSQRRSWSPMDYAVSGFFSAQNVSREHAAKGLRIIQALERAGASISEAKEINRVSGYGDIRSYKDAAITLLGMDVLRQAGLVTDEQFDIAARGDHSKLGYLRSVTTISPDFFASHYDARINDYRFALPGRGMEYKVAEGDTLAGLQERFALITGDLSIADKNNLKAGTALTPGVTLHIPSRPGIEAVAAKVQGDDSTWVKTAQQLAANKIYYRDASEAEILAELGKLNNFDPHDPMLESMVVPKGTPFYIPYKADMYEAQTRMTAPETADPARVVELYITEKSSRREMHHDHLTFRAATHRGYAMNPEIKYPPFASFDELMMVYPHEVGNRDALRILMNLPEGNLSERIMFSHSMGLKMSSEQAERYRQNRGPDNFDLENIRLNQPYFEKSKPIIFHAAGNFYPGEGRFIPSIGIMHSPKTVMVGAVAEYKPGQTAVIAPYSTVGADVCAMLPTYHGKTMDGTSFATPDLAAQARQYTEWYGNKLTFNEIMAAGMMTTDTKLEDFTDHLSANTVVTSDNPNKDYTGFKTLPAAFNANGGGLPRNERCGAGVINNDRWEKALKDMVALKEQTGPSREISVFVAANDENRSVVAGENGKPEYVYKLKVTEDMTLGRLQFFMPQMRNAHGDATVKTPAGYEWKLPYSLIEVVSTNAFAYEDVKAGDVIELRTTQPLAANAGLQLRGHADGNVIQKLRDKLQAEGIMPRPLAVITGKGEGAPPRP